jgi:hypothetical protein
MYVRYTRQTKDERERLYLERLRYTHRGCTGLTRSGVDVVRAIVPMAPGIAKTSGHYTNSDPLGPGGLTPIAIAPFCPSS